MKNFYHYLMCFLISMSGTVSFCAQKKKMPEPTLAQLNVLPPDAAIESYGCCYNIDGYPLKVVVAVGPNTTVEGVARWLPGRLRPYVTPASIKAAVQSPSRERVEIDGRSYLLRNFADQGKQEQKEEQLK